MSLQVDPGLRTEAEPVSEEDAEAYVASVCFKTGPPYAVGVEVERLVQWRDDPRRRLTVPGVRAILDPLSQGLPGGGNLSLEPGGQVELSSACAPNLRELLPRVRDDLAAVDRLLDAAGLACSPLALDAHRRPFRSLEHPRYAAMQRHFDAAGRAGRTMMCSTASLQVCLQSGRNEREDRERWDRAHRLLPLLVAMFANSPLECHRRGPRKSGWGSTRQRVWSRIEPERTQAVPHRVPGTDPAEAWARYALDAPVLCVPSTLGPWDAPRGLTLREWLRSRSPRQATLPDVDYHLTTLFPPIRPRGFLELRALDAQAGADWEAAAVLTTALMDDGGAAAAADEACEGLSPSPEEIDNAARRGLDDPLLARAAVHCAEAALRALPRLGLDEAARSRVEQFAETYPLRGRCPADDRLERWEKEAS
jgi:glutamate--cysteine ligase